MALCFSQMVAHTGAGSAGGFFLFNLRIWIEVLKYWNKPLARESRSLTPNNGHEADCLNVFKGIKRFIYSAWL